MMISMLPSIRCSKCLRSGKLTSTLAASTGRYLTDFISALCLDFLILPRIFFFLDHSFLRWLLWETVPFSRLLEFWWIWVWRRGAGDSVFLPFSKWWLRLLTISLSFWGVIGGRLLPGARDTHRLKVLVCLCEFLTLFMVEILLVTAFRDWYIAIFLTLLEWTL